MGLKQMGWDQSHRGEGLRVFRLLRGGLRVSNWAHATVRSGWAGEGSERGCAACAAAGSVNGGVESCGGGEAIALALGC